MPKNDIEGPVHKTFYYHADASAIGGTIHRPFSGFVPSQTSISLPLVGGFLEKERKGRKWKDIVSYTNESTRVSGSKQDPDKDGPWTTEVSASIEGLNILGVIEADKVVAQLSVAHPHNGEQPTIALTGSKFENLRISGAAIDLDKVIRYDLFSEHDRSAEPDHRNRYPKELWPRQEKLREKIKNQKILAIQKYAAKYKDEPIPNWIHHHFHELEHDPGPNAKKIDLQRKSEDLAKDLIEEDARVGLNNDGNYVICSLIDHFPDLPPNFPGIVCGNGVYLPGYGRFFFGEVIIQQGTFRVSMIRAQLGSGIGGAMSAGVASSNGQGSGPKGG